MENDIIRQQLVKHLQGGEAFIPLKDIVEVIPFEKLHERPYDLPYSFYELFFHIRYAQRDILDFCMAEVYEESSWPTDYWPDVPGPENEQSWEKLKSDYFRERELFTEFILDKNNDLLQPVKHGKKQSLLREVLLVMEHTSYHTGQLLLISRLLGIYS